MQEYAALLVNIYIYAPRGTSVDVVSFVEGVCRREALTPQPDFPDHMRYHGNETTKTLLQWFVPFAPAANDTIVVQLAMEERGTPDAVWPRLRARADPMVGDAYATYHTCVFGYTLIYYAMLPPETAALTYCDHLLKQGAIQRLGAETQPLPGRIAQAALADGHLFLLATPVGDGKLAATIYLALGALRPTDEPLRLMTEGLFGRGATMLMPDLIAHKSYAQQRVLQRKFGQTASANTTWQDVYHNQVENLRTAVCNVLALHPAGEIVLAETDLRSLIAAYEELVSRWIDLDGYYIVLEQQHHNYAWWQRATGGGPVIEYHGEALRIAAKELAIQMQNGQHVLDVARTTVEIARTHMEKQRLQAEKEAEQRTEQDRELVAGLLAAISIGLAIPQFVTWNVACGWLVHWGCMAPTECTDYLSQRPFFLQFGIAALFAGLVFMLARRYWRWRQRSGPGDGR